MTRSRFTFLHDRRPGLIRSVLLTIALGSVLALLLAHWAELQGGMPP